MNEKLMFKEVVELCKACGEAINRIAFDCNINQNAVARLFIKTMELIVDEIEEKVDREQT